MKTKDKFLLLMVSMVLVPVIVVWYTAWPLITEWNLPVIEEVQQDIPVTRAFTKEEVASLNHWISQHRSGWGTSGESPPTIKENIHLLLGYESLENGQKVKKSYELSFWHFKHGDDVVAIQGVLHGAYRMRSLSTEESKNLQHILGH